MTQAKGKEEAILKISVKQTLSKTSSIQYYEFLLFQILLSSSLNLVF